MTTEKEGEMFSTHKKETVKITLIKYGGERGVRDFKTMYGERQG